MSLSTRRNQKCLVVPRLGQEKEKIRLDHPLKWWTENTAPLLWWLQPEMSPEPSVRNHQTSPNREAWFGCACPNGSGHKRQGKAKGQFQIQDRRAGRDPGFWTCKEHHWDNWWGRNRICGSDANTSSTWISYFDAYILRLWGKSLLLGNTTI